MVLTLTELSGLASRTASVEDTWLQAGRAWQDGLTKSSGSLGELKVIRARLCEIAIQCPPPISSNPKVIAFAADHGVYAQGVTPWPQEASVQMAAGITIRFAGVCVTSRASGAGTEVSNVGLLQRAEGIVDRRIMTGTADFTQGPAMTVKQVSGAIGVGIKAANAVISSGANVLVPGKVGLANTTPIVALTAAFTGKSMVEVTGRGAGADNEVLTYKVAVIEKGLEVGGVARLIIEGDAVGALAAVGGFEHAAMTGLMLIATARRVPVVLDEVVFCSTALVAHAICPDVVGYLVVGHASVRPAITAAHETLGLRGLVDLGLRPGEDSGGALTPSLVKATALITNETGTFSDQGVSKAWRVPR